MGLHFCGLLTLVLMALPAVARADQPAPDAPRYWLNRAQATIPQVPEPAEQAALYARMAEVHALLGDVTSYEQALAETEAALTKVGEDANRKPLRDAQRHGMHLIKRLVKAGEVARARELASTSAKAYEQSAEVPFKELAGALARRGNLEEALGVAKRFEASKHSEILVAIIQGLCEQEDLVSAVRVAREIPAQDHRQREEAFKTVAYTLAEVGQAEEARNVADQFLESLSQLDVYRRIAALQAKSGDDEAAYATVEAMPEPKRLPRWAFDHGKPAALRDIARAQWERGSFEAAQRTIDRMEGQPKVLALRDMTRALLEAGKLDQARHVAEAMPPGRDAHTSTAPRTEALRDVAVALAERGQIQQARKLAQADPESADILEAVAQAVLLQGKQQEALEIIEAALKDMPLSPLGAAPPVHSRLEYLAIQVRHGEEAALDDAIRKVHVKLRGEDDKRMRKAGSKHLAALYLAKAILQGDQLAARLAMAGFDEDQQFATIGIAAHLLADQGKLAQTRELLPLVPPSRRREFLRPTAYAYLKADQAQALADWLETLPDLAERTSVYLWAAQAVMKDQL